MSQSYRRQILDPLGLVARIFDELGIGEVPDQATQQDPAMRMATVGKAVKAMALTEELYATFSRWCPTCDPGPGIRKHDRGPERRRLLPISSWRAIAAGQRS
jgi:hypothetical protein